MTIIEAHRRHVVADGSSITQHVFADISVAYHDGGRDGYPGDIRGGWPRRRATAVVRHHAAIERRWDLSGTRSRSSVIVPVDVGIRARPA